jgi:glycine cleavage system aminomethyltransferase T
VHRKFSAFAVEAGAVIAAGDKIFSGKAGEDEKEVGEVTSAATFGTPPGERTIALGYIRREVAVPGREVAIGAAKATVIQLPIENFALGQAEDSVLHQA